MKLPSEQLSTHLSKHFAALYLLHGDEPLLLQEAADAVRAAARERGYSERECLLVDSGFNWGNIRQSCANLSLFANRRVLELRLETTKLSDKALEFLGTYAQSPPEHIVLLIICDKLDSMAQNSRWFKALEKVGVVVQVRPLELSRLPVWIEQRMQAKGLYPTADAVALLAERVEGNLLAAVQEIDKLNLLFGRNRITAQQLTTVVSDSARYSVYDLVDVALAGQTERSLRILRGLRDEGLEPALVSWALHREIRLLNLLSFELSQGQSLEMTLNRHRVWEKRKPLLRRFLQRMTVNTCRHLLNDCARLDRLVKGLEPGNPWDELVNVSLRLAGRELFKPLAVIP
jgi:DNA polymerase-3 subunit delta